MLKGSNALWRQARTEKPASGLSLQAVTTTSVPRGVKKTDRWERKERQKGYLDLCHVTNPCLSPWVRKSPASPWPVVLLLSEASENQKPEHTSTLAKCMSLLCGQVPTPSAHLLPSQHTKAVMRTTNFPTLCCTWFPTNLMGQDLFLTGVCLLPHSSRFSITLLSSLLFEKKEKQKWTCRW